MNNLYTLGYFRHRILSAGIPSKIIVKKYADNDDRYWTISLFGEKHVFCTCYKVDSEFWFEFWDGNNIIKNKRIIKTQSINVIIKSVLSWVYSNKS